MHSLYVIFCHISFFILRYHLNKGIRIFIWIWPYFLRCSILAFLLLLNYCLSSCIVSNNHYNIVIYFVINHFNVRDYEENKYQSTHSVRILFILGFWLKVSIFCQSYKLIYLSDNISENNRCIEFVMKLFRTRFFLHF